MRERLRDRRAPCLLAAPFAALLFVGAPGHAENIDPASDGSQWAWAENVGWINGEPDGDGGPGMLIEDFTVGGWLWGENVGWISLTCANTASCDVVDYAVRHDGTGALSGEAWAENVGWIRFETTQSSVWVDPSTGNLHGHAWGENVGWISFRSSGPHPHGMRSGWTCDPPPPLPADPPIMRIGKIGTEAWVAWDPVPGATGYDVAWGYLGGLRGTAGDFYQATEGCLADNETGTELVDPDVPPPGDAYWYLVRAVNCSGAGTYDAWGGSQPDPRDEEIGDSTRDCRVP